MTWIEWLLIAVAGGLWAYGLVLVIRRGREDARAEDKAGPGGGTGGVVR